MATIDKQALKDAVARRSVYILENKETITMNQCRKLLEEDLGLPEKSLKSEKDYVKKLIDQIFLSTAAADEPAAPSQSGQPEDAAPASEDDSPQPKKARRKVSEDDGSSRKKLKQKEAKNKAKRKEKEVASAAASAPTGKDYGREVQKLKRICRSASITIPPSVYTRVTEEQDVVDRLKAVLQKHGLSAQATQDDIAQVRKDLQMQRDLDGIDMSNILSEGRGRRATAAAPRKYSYSYKGALSDSDADDEDADEENARPANVSPGSKIQKGKKPNGTVELSNASESAEDDASDSEASGLSQPSTENAIKEETRRPGGIDSASSDLQPKKTKLLIAAWSDDDD